MTRPSFPGQQGGPLEHAIAAKAVAFKEASQPSFSEYTAQIVANAQAFGNALANEGFRMVSGGTDNHMVLLDLRDFDGELTGKVAQEVLDRAGITTNRNTIPDDPRSPFVTSGLRVGTAAETTAGMKEGEFETIASLMSRALRKRDDEALWKRCATTSPRCARRSTRTPTSRSNPWATLPPTPSSR